MGGRETIVDSATEGWQKCQSVRLLLCSEQISVINFDGDGILVTSFQRNENFVCGMLNWIGIRCGV
jgi:hypothetical protein